MVRWRGRRESENVEDRRSEGGRAGFPFPMGQGGFRIPTGGRKGGGIGIMGILIILGLMFFFGVDPSVIMQGGDTGVQIPDIQLPKRQGKDTEINTTGRQSPKAQAPATTGDDDLKSFVAVVLADTEDVWQAVFKQYGRTYQEPKLVLFSGAVQSACGTGMSQMGPFYCPLDRKVYVDLAFYKDLKTRFQAPGDFAQAYVIAHEVGHHVQTLLGIADKVQRAKARMSQKESNALQVRMELQADCFAGAWAKHAQRTKDILEPGDIDEALNAASAIGDDRIQKQQQGYVVPDAFTHGSSKQRVRWFRRGYDSGDIQQCDTFNASSL